MPTEHLVGRPSGSDRMPRRRVLLISYVFPPVGGIMVQRVLSFARYLPDHHLDVFVLTCRNPATPVYDEALAALVPAAVRVARAFTPEPPFYLRKKVWALFSRGGQATTTTPAAAPRGSGLRGAVRRRDQQWLSPDPQVLCPAPDATS